jgi:hypothetical protein
MAQKMKVRNRIGRTIYETHCIGSRYDPEKRKTVQFKDVLPGNIQNVERAATKLRAKYGTKSLIVEELHHFKSFVSAPMDKFMEIVDEKTEQEID